MFLRLWDSVINYNYIVSISYREADCSRIVDNELEVREDYKQPQLRIKLNKGEWPYIDIDFDTKELAKEWLDNFCNNNEVFYHQE